MARALVNERLAACVNVLAPCRSIYVWEGKTCDESEVPVLIKTTRRLFDDLEQRIRALHPYECPEIIALDVQDGFPGYLQWVSGQVAPLS